jgi:anaerobic magnesium-protoporphyrin IX monomethyl ester cyclase
MSSGVDVLLLTTPRAPHLSPAAVQVSENSAPPLGLLCVAAALEEAGFSVAVADFYQGGQKPRDVVDLIEMLRPRIVGVSALTSGIHMAYRVCRHVKSAAPEIHTVIGGPHATALPDEVLSHPEVDIVVRGEGEQTMVELARVLLGRERSRGALFFLAGLNFRNGSSLAATPDRAPMAFDLAPMPARHLVPMQDYLQRGAIVSSRGCTYRCWFCSSVTFNTHKYRYRSNELVLQEMDLLKDRYGTQSFEFIEDTFTCIPDRILGLAGLLRNRDYDWSCQATIPDLEEHPALLPSMVEAGCRGLFFGIESGNDDVLKKIKHMSRRKILGTIDRARSLGVKHFVTSFIIGHPWDTRETIADTLDLILELRARGAHTPVSILVPFPGSPIAKWPEKFGITIHSFAWEAYYYNHALISTPNLSREELDEIYFSILERVVATAGKADAVGEMSRSRIADVVAH